MGCVQGIANAGASVGFCVSTDPKSLVHWAMAARFVVMPQVRFRLRYLSRSPMWQKSLLLPSGPTCPTCREALGSASIQVQLERQIREHTEALPGVGRVGRILCVGTGRGR